MLYVSQKFTHFIVLYLFFFFIITGIYTIYTYKSINEIKVLMGRK